MGVNQLIYTIDKDELGCPHGHSPCEGAPEFQRGEIVARSISNQRVIRNYKTDIAEVRGRAGRKIESTSCKDREWCVCKRSYARFPRRWSQEGEPTTTPLREIERGGGDSEEYRGDG